MLECPICEVALTKEWKLVRHFHIFHRGIQWDRNGRICCECGWKGEALILVASDRELYEPYIAHCTEGVVEHLKYVIVLRALREMSNG